MYSKMHSQTMRCGCSHTAICTYRSEVDVPWGRMLMPSLTLAPHTNSTLKQLWR